MAPFKRVLTFALVLLPANFYAMEAGWHSVPVQVKFAPHNDIKDTLFSLLNNAKHQVVIAMYWLTDNSIINLLTALKQKGIDIKVILDESSLKEVDRTNNLFKAGIVPLIFPSRQTASEDQNFMHHKFLVIDETIVFTGSANFTQKAIEYRSNYENVVIIHSKEIARDYIAAFRGIELDTFNWYIHMAKEDNVHRIAWANRLLPKLYSTKPLLQKMVYEQWTQSDAIMKDRIAMAFNIEFITPEQKAFLRKQNIMTEGMSKQHASMLIKKINQQEKEALKELESEAMDINQN